MAAAETGMCRDVFRLMVIRGSRCGGGGQWALFLAVAAAVWVSCCRGKDMGKGVMNVDGAGPIGEQHNEIVLQLMERLERLEAKCYDARSNKEHTNTQRVKRSSNENMQIDSTVLNALTGNAEKKSDKAIFIAPNSDRNPYIFPKEGKLMPTIRAKSRTEQGDDTKYQSEHTMIFDMLLKQSTMLKDHHSRLQAVSDLVFRHTETMDHITSESVILHAENKRLVAKVDRLQSSLDLYQLASDNFVNHTNGVLKRIRRVEQNLESLYRDEGTRLQSMDDFQHDKDRLLKSQKRLAQRVERLENITDYQTYKAYSASKVKTAARKIDNDESDINDADVDDNRIEIFDPKGGKIQEIVRLNKKYKKMSKLLEDTTQKLYRLSNFVSDSSTLMHIIESGQDVGMRNDEYLADNQMALRKKVSSMETKLQDIYLHYREDMRRHGGLLPEEVAPTFEYDQIFSSTRSPVATPSSQSDIVGIQQNEPVLSTSPAAPLALKSSSLPLPDQSTSYKLPDSTMKVTQYYVTPPPSPYMSASVMSSQHRSAAAGAGLTTTGSATQDPRISKRTTLHDYDYPTVEITKDDSELPATAARESSLSHGTKPTEKAKAEKVKGQSHVRDKEDPGHINQKPMFPQRNCHVAAIGPPQPIAFRGDFVSGTWLRDDGIKGSPIYVTTGSDEFRQILVYNDLWYLINNNYSEVITLPFHCAGSGHVIYLGSLYCNKKNSNRLMRYDLEYKVVTSHKLFKAGYNNTYPYTIGLATDLDFAVDESGLWVIYGSSKHDGQLAVAKIDPHTLDVQQEWITKFKKKEAVNAFIVCGKVYIVVQNKETVAAEIQQVFDTHTASMRKLEKILKFSGKPVYLTMLDYNPMESALHGWGFTRSFLGELLIYNVLVEVSD